MPFLRVIRDKRGYETTYLMHWYREGNRQRSRILYVFRSPGGVRVGREPLEPEMIRQIEAQHPDIAFDWKVVRENQQIVETAPGTAPAAGTRDRTKAKRCAASTRAGRGTRRRQPVPPSRPEDRRGHTGRADRVSAAAVSRDPRADSAADARSGAAGDRCWRSPNG